MRATISGLHLSARMDGDKLRGQLLVESPDGDEAVNYQSRSPNGLSALTRLSKLTPVTLEVDVRMSTYEGRSFLSVRPVRCIDPELDVTF